MLSRAISRGAAPVVRVMPASAMSSVLSRAGSAPLRVFSALPSATSAKSRAAARLSVLTMASAPLARASALPADLSAVLRGIPGIASTRSFSAAPNANPIASATTSAALPAAAAAPASSGSGSGSNAGASSGAGATDTTTQKVGRLRHMMQVYGPIAIGTYLGIYVIVLGCIFLFVNSSFGMTAQEVIAMVEGWGILSESLKKRLDGMVEGASPLMVNFAAAWILTKFTEPLRLVIAGALTPRVARWIGKAPASGPGAAAAAAALFLLPAREEQRKRQQQDETAH